MGEIFSPSPEVALLPPSQCFPDRSSTISRAQNKQTNKQLQLLPSATPKRTTKKEYLAVIYCLFRTTKKETQRNILNETLALKEAAGRKYGRMSVADIACVDLDARITWMLA